MSINTMVMKKNLFPNILNSVSHFIFKSASSTIHYNYSTVKEADAMLDMKSNFPGFMATK